MVIESHISPFRRDENY